MTPFDVIPLAEDSCLLIFRVTYPMKFGITNTSQLKTVYEITFSELYLLFHSIIVNVCSSTKIRDFNFSLMRQHSSYF